MSWVQKLQPTRAEYIVIVRNAARGSGLPPAIKRKLTIHAKKTPYAVYGIDAWAGSLCPLRAVGVERVYSDGAWKVHGAHHFERSYDKAMQCRVGLSGPCLVGIGRNA